MSRNLMDAMKLYAPHAIVLTNGLHRLRNTILETVVEQEYEFGVDVTLLHPIQQTSHSGSELTENASLSS